MFVVKHQIKFNSVQLLHGFNNVHTALPEIFVFKNKRPVIN